MAMTLTTFFEADAIVAPAAAAAAKYRVYMDSTTSDVLLSRNTVAADILVLRTAAQTLTNKTLTTPTIGDFTNSTHTHAAAATGGQLTNAALTSGAYAAITGVGVQAQNLNMNSNKIVNLAAPTADGDAARKLDVDVAKRGLDLKDSVRVATNAALPANTAAGSQVGKTLTMTAVGVLTVDGVATVLNDDVLVKNEAAGANNGIYRVTTEGTAGVAAVLTRRTDADENAEVTSGMFAYVADGTANGDQGFGLTTNDPITVDTTALSFTQITGAGQITAGAGLTKTGNTLDVGAAFGVTVAADSVGVDLTAAFTGANAWTGNHAFNANVTFGDTTADTVTVTARLASSLDPNIDNTRALGTNSLRYSDVVGVQLRVFPAAGDTNASARLSSNSLELGAGGATALDVALTRGAANQLDLASGDSFNIVSGQFLKAGVAVLEADNDVAITLLPNADNSLNIGSAARRWANVFAAIVTTGDLNMRSADGASDWTLVEQPDGIMARNNHTGDQYRIGLEPWAEAA